MNAPHKDFARELEAETLTAARRMLGAVGFLLGAAGAGIITSRNFFFRKEHRLTGLGEPQNSSVAREGSEKEMKPNVIPPGYHTRDTLPQPSAAAQAILERVKRSQKLRHPLNASPLAQSNRTGGDRGFWVEDKGLPSVDPSDKGLPSIFDPK